VVQLSRAAEAMRRILVEQAQDVMDVYSTWFDFEPPAADEGWVRLAGSKR
jgi:ribosomal protein L11 methyltransferase